jgi:hypothetical protein
MSTKIQAVKSKYFDNVIWSIDFYDVKLPIHIEQKLKHYDLMTFPGTELKNRLIKKLYVDCNHTNPFSPSKLTIQRNQAFLNDILSLGDMVEASEVDHLEYIS